MWRILLLTLVLAAAPLVNSYADVSQWKVHPAYTADVEKVVVTPGKAYVLAAGNLFSYDTESNERVSHTVLNGMSGHGISGIWYDKYQKFLLVAYSDGNVDLLYDDGRIVNLPDIKHASADLPKAIHDVAFDNAMIYMATDFGIVVTDSRKHDTVASGIYHRPMNAVTLSGSCIVVAGDDGTIYKMDKNARLSSADCLDPLCTLPGIKAMAATDGSDVLLLTSDSGSSTLSLLDISSGQIRNTVELDGPSGFISEYANGKYIVTPTSLYEINSEAGNVSSRTTLPEALKGNAAGTWRGASSVWCADASGVGHYDMSVTPARVLADKYLPESLTVKDVAYIIPSADGERLYITNLGPSVYRTVYFGTPQWEGDQLIQKASRLADGKFLDVSLRHVDGKHYLAAMSQTDGREGRFTAPVKLSEDPDDEDVYFIGTGHDGLYKVRRGELEGRYDPTNSPIEDIWGWRVFGTSVDPDGDLWVTQMAVTPGKGLLILPADKRRLDPASVKVSDWIIADMPQYKGDKDVEILHCSNSPVTLIIDADPEITLIAYDKSARRGVIHRQFVDQDGKYFAPERSTSIIEDRAGRIWLSTDMGIVEIASAADAMDENMVVRRIKVPRNDGTGLADYLLDTDMIYDMAVDNSNRKWIATASSGLYLVNADGTEIIKRFTAADSPLPSDRVQAVYADPRSTSVYIGTSEGLVEYTASTSPASDSYTTLTAYPNPVRPDYSGPVTIKGLIDGSLVKITDALGHLVYEGRSEGGSLQWDCCTASGHRVASGVYNVIASYYSGSDSQTASIKILIVN